MKELEHEAAEVAKILKLLAHPKRLLVLCKLGRWEKFVSELERECSISQSQLSQFLTKMREDGILEHRKQGQNVAYRVSDARILPLLDSLAAIYCPPDNQS